MRLSISLILLLAWLPGAAFASDLHTSPLFPTAPTEAMDQSFQQSDDKAPEESAVTVAVWDRAAAWIWAKQREFHRSLTRELRALRGQTGVGWALILMGFLYGVLHAAGPGHGKAVLTTYLLTHRQQLQRGIVMGISAAMLQGISAVVLVYGLIGLAGWLPRETETATVWATRVSFALLIAVGLYLLMRALISLARGVNHWREATTHSHHDHDHDHDHDHQHDRGRNLHGDNCGCRHLPTTDEIETAGDRRAALGVVFAIGLRPCTGAVLVLILASVMDLTWQGVLAVLAMSVGTAITIVMLAILATKAREWASTLIAHQSPLWALAGGGAGAIGGVLLMALGLLLLSMSFAMTPALGL